MPKYESIIFFVETPFTERDEKRFGIRHLMQKGFDVRVFQLEQVFQKEIYSTLKKEEAKNKYITVVSNFQNLEAFLSSDKNSKLVILIMEYHNSLLKLLNNNNIDYALLCTNQIPLSTENQNVGFLGRLKQKYLDEGMLNILKKIPRYFKRFLNNLNRTKLLIPKYIIAGGSRSIEHIPDFIINNTRIIWTHSLDFDLYLDAKLQKNLPNEYTDIFGRRFPFELLKNSIIFLDEYSPYHPDNTFLNIDYADKVETYYPRLIKFFQYLENKFHTKVVIAAHPRSDYSDKDHFKSFIVIKNRTLDLVAHSRFALIHSSTSINFINLFEKNAIFFNTSSMRRIYKEATSIFAKLHGRYSIEVDIDTDFDQLDFEKILSQEMNFSTYRDSYIKKIDSKLDYSWNIIAEEFR